MALKVATVLMDPPDLALEGTRHSGVKDLNLLQEWTGGVVPTGI